MNAFRFLFCIALLTVFTLPMQAQESPRWNSPFTATYPSGVYIPLPETNFIIPVTQPRVIVTSIGTFVVSPNIRVHPSNNQQTEVPLVRHPTNQNIMLGGSNATNGSFISEGWYVTTDGGVTWFGSDTLNAGGNLAQQRGDPGPIVDINNRLLMTHLTSNTVFGGVTGMGASYSTNFGATWSANVQISTNSGDDKNLATTNDVAPYAGHSYIAWTRLSGVTGNGWFSRTTDGGVSWSAPIQINTTPSGYFAQGHDLGKTGPQGQIHVAWTLGQQTSPYTERYVGFARSTNGGTSFIVTEQAYPVFGTRSFSFNGWGIRTNAFPRIDCDRSGGPRNGWIYIVTDEANLAPAGSDADVVLHRSTDGGLTWSAGIRVNQDPLNNGKVQFFPCIRVDEGGGVNVVYYDNRLFPSVGDSCSVWMSRSTDGGTTWADMEVADHHFLPKPTPGLGGGYMGDYIGVTSGNGKVWPFWTDDKVPALRFQAWTTGVDIAPPAPGDLCRRGLNKAIPDNDTLNGIYDTLNVNLGNNLCITNVKVTIDTLNHTWVGDMIINLIHQGVNVYIMNRPGPGTFGASGINFIGTKFADTARYSIDSIVSTPGPPLGYPYTGWFRCNRNINTAPTQMDSLSRFNGLNPNGLWILRCRDAAAADLGFLRSWCITITYQTCTGIEQTVTIPNSYSLSQNFPNPFNPVTNISYGLPKAGKVKLIVFDILGRVVATPVDEYKAAGIHTVKFDGSALASGAYFYRIESGTFINVKKMLLVK
jgi:subtilisin-like proprotein convertase family protein